MKKVFLSLVTLAVLVCAPFAFAETDARLTGGYASSGLPHASLPIPNKSLLDPYFKTNIVIINFSPYYMHVILPDYPGAIDQQLVTGGTAIITNKDARQTRVAILNEYNTWLFDMQFCRYAIAIIDQEKVPPYKFRLNPYDFYCKQ